MSVYVKVFKTKKDYQLLSPPDSPFCEFQLRNAKYFSSLATTMDTQI